jgi:hypothetical protein
LVSVVRLVLAVRLAVRLAVVLPHLAPTRRRPLVLMVAVRLRLVRLRLEVLQEFKRQARLRMH